MTTVDIGNGRNGSTEGKPLVHKVEMPPKRSFLKEVGSGVRETFFHDPPIQGFKGLSRGQQVLQSLKFLFPILDWLSTYSLKMFFKDFLAGLTIASLAVPQDLGYASLTGIPPVYGLYSSFVPPLVYAVLGTSRNIAIGPVAVVSLLLGELLKQELSPTEDAAEYLQLAFTATFFAGIFQAGLGILRYISCPFMYQKFPNEYWRLNHAKDGPGFTRHFLVPFLTHGCFV